jgi:molecular chaperone DnaK
LVGFDGQGDRVVGEAARHLSFHSPHRVASATKRWIGRRFSEALAEEARRAVPYPLVEGPNGEVRVKLGGQVVPVTQISAILLGQLALDAQSYLGQKVQKAVITVPANFDDLQRQATKEAAQIAGLEVLRLVNEPTAAAVAYGLASDFRGRALVFDLGGGTFDVSILEVEEGVFQVRATGGDPYLGGEDFDQRIVQWLLAQLPDSHRELATKDGLSLQKLRAAAEIAKRELTVSDEAFISVPELGDHLNGKLTDLETALTRGFFEQLSEPLSRRCLAVCERVMADARLGRTDVSAVLLVGGMTRVPLVQKLVQDFFGQTPAKGINPDEAVALGAAIQAAELTGAHRGALLMDVASVSLGVEVMGGKVRPLIPRNTALPAKAKEVFLPSGHDQRSARIRVFQGESEYADENVKLGEVVVTALRRAERAENPLEVQFELSTEGTLSVTATDLSTGRSEHVQIEARTELSPEEVARLAAEQAARSSDERAAIEKRQFERVLDRVERMALALQQGAQETPTADAEALVAHVQALLDSGRAALHGGDLVQMSTLAPQLSALLTSPRSP